MGFRDYLILGVRGVGFLSMVCLLFGGTFGLSSCVILYDPLMDLETPDSRTLFIFVGTTGAHQNLGNDEHTSTPLPRTYCTARQNTKKPLPCSINEER